jgi:hypothetical protein
MLVGFQLLAVVGMSLNLIVPALEPKLWPLIVIWLPMPPDGCDKLEMVGRLGVTMSVVESETFPEVAVIVAVPVPTPVANPAPSIITTEAEDELQVAVLVRSFVLPSL